MTALGTISTLGRVLRAPSSTPEGTVEALAEKVHVPVPGDKETRQNRVQGLGTLNR